MCGIVGFTGNHQAAPILLYGLSDLNTEVMIQRDLQFATAKVIQRLLKRKAD